MPDAIPVGPNNHSWGDYDFSERSVELLDTSLRDGLQDAQIRHPTFAEKMGLLQRLLAVGVDAVDIAIPVAGGPHLRDAIGLIGELPSSVQPVCLARTVQADITAAAEMAQRSGRSIEVIVFVGSSPVRRWVEGWLVADMIAWMEESVTLAVKEGLKATIATEHTTETEPEVIRRIFRAGLESGGRRVCIADTSGAATPRSVVALLDFFRSDVLDGFPGTPIDWHGHEDRGLSVVNALTALEAGATRVHGTVLGIGERAGNTPLEPLLLNLKIAGDPKRQDISRVPALSEYGSRVFGVPIRVDYPGIGEKVGLTASGIHAAAMLKARRLGIEAGLPYSIVDRRWFNREADVRIGPLSGRANVEWVAQKLGIPCSDELVEMALAAATEMNRLLSDEELVAMARGPRGSSPGVAHE